MVDLHDEGPGVDAPVANRPRRRSNGSNPPRRTKTDPGANGDPRAEDLSGGIPRPPRHVIATVDVDRSASDQGDAAPEPVVPPWVNDGSTRAVTAAEQLVVLPVEAREAPTVEPEPLVIVPAVQPDELPGSPAATELDEVTSVPVSPPAVTRRQLRLPRRARVRRVTRVVRYIDPWGVFKIALLFNLVGYVTTLVSGVLLWNVAHATGTVDNLERFLESFGWESFEFDGGQIFHNAWIIGLFLVVAATGLAVLAATVFNLVTDLVGGIRVTVLEEELVASPARPWLRPVTPSPVVASPTPGPVVPSVPAEAAPDDGGMPPG